MAKLLRPGEKISFVQTRAPTPMWRYIKGLAIANASDGTATRLCTNAMLEYLQLRRWQTDSLLRPQDLERKTGATGFQQVNLPLSNQDEEGHPIASHAYLQRLGITDLFDRDKHAYRAALVASDFSKLVYVAAAQLEVSGATLGYSFLYWLSVVKYKPSSSSEMHLDTDQLPIAKQVEPAKPAPRAARSKT